MKRIFTALLLLAISVAALAKDPQGPKKVSVLGDSYSAFASIIPQGYIPYYPNEACGVTEQSQMWWQIVCDKCGLQLEKVNAWSGSALCNTGYGNYNPTSAFIGRTDLLGNPDIILVCGGTNDSWGRSPIGDYKYRNWSDEELGCFRPAMAKLLKDLKKKYPKAQILFVLNNDLSYDIDCTVLKLCAKYKVQVVELHDISKVNAHPDKTGMEQFAEQVIPFIKK